MSPDLKQNFAVTLYLLFSHNYIAFVYSFGVIISAFLSLKRPSRFTTLMLLGFIVLLFSYQYDKHIIEGFRQQTLNSLITITPHYRLQRIINILIADIFPIFFYITGWGVIFVGIVYAALSLDKKPKK